MKGMTYGLQYKESQPIQLEGPNIVFKTGEIQYKATMMFDIGAAKAVEADEKALKFGETQYTLESLGIGQSRAKTPQGVRCRDLIGAAVS